MLQALPDLPAGRAPGRRPALPGQPEPPAGRRRTPRRSSRKRSPSWRRRSSSTCSAPRSRRRCRWSACSTAGWGRRRRSGQIDRLAVTEEAVVIVDYKTNRPPPETPEQVPQVYRAQLATYRRLVQRIWPDRRVETWLLWTDGPRLMQITDA
ncbi:MAG: PD-(D/E)XK nuclease family protein [Rhodovibrio sp.]|nr:PD-(D/E)XK nuclease family protein [Rhodovibrio sp.]